MEELYLQTKDGNIKIDPYQVSKYTLKEGTVSPFTKFRIVDKFGNYNFEGKETSSPTPDEMPKGEGQEDDEIVEFKETGAILSQSEIIDFSHGTDSDIRDSD